MGLCGCIFLAKVNFHLSMIAVQVIVVVRKNPLKS